MKTENSYWVVIIMLRIPVIIAFCEYMYILETCPIEYPIHKKNAKARLLRTNKVSTFLVSQYSF